MLLFLFWICPNLPFTDHLLTVNYQNSLVADSKTPCISSTNAKHYIIFEFCHCFYHLISISAWVEYEWTRPIQWCKYFFSRQPLYTNTEQNRYQSQNWPLCIVMQHTYIILQQPVFSSPEAVAAHSKKEQYVHKISSKHLIFSILVIIQEVT